MSAVHRCIECGDIITEDQDFVEGHDDPDKCELCNEESNVGAR